MQIPNYQIHEKIGKGRLAVVYHAVQTSLKRPAAVKLMSPILLEDSRFTDKFIQESQLTARLIHPNIIHLYDTGTWEQQPYLVLEKLSSSSLAERSGRELDIEKVFQIIFSIADALSYAHRQDRAVDRPVRAAAHLSRGAVR
jgi:serine/threonine protein kinase